jgi:hypothetical protein
MKKGKHKFPALERAILGGRSDSARGIMTLRNQWRDFPQCVEYRAAKEILSLASLLFLLCFLSLSSGARMTTGRRRSIMRQGVRVSKGNHLFSSPRGVIAEAARQRTLAKHSEVHGICLHDSTTSRTSCPLLRAIRQPYPK